MIKFEAKIPQDMIDKILNAAKRVYASVRIEGNRLPMLCSMEFRQLLVQNIIRGVHPPYTPYNTRYFNWKMQHGTYARYWMLMGDLLGSIRYWKHSDKQWLSGIPPGVLDSGNKSWYPNSKVRPMYVGQYARWMEFGRTSQPARPIVGPTMLQYGADFMPDKVNQSMKRIRDKWH